MPRIILVGLIFSLLLVACEDKSVPQPKLMQDQAPSFSYYLYGAKKNCTLYQIIGQPQGASFNMTINAPVIKVGAPQLFIFFVFNGKGTYTLSGISSLNYLQEVYYAYYNNVDVDSTSANEPGTLTVTDYVTTTSGNTTLHHIAGTFSAPRIGITAGSFTNITW